MKPAEDRAKLLTVQAALEGLLTGELRSRSELFGEAKSDSAKQFQRKMVKVLETNGLISRIETGHPPVTRIRLKNRVKVEYLLKNEIEVSQLIWPGSAPPKEVVTPEAPFGKDVFVTIKKSTPQEAPKAAESKKTTDEYFKMLQDSKELTKEQATDLANWLKLKNPGAEFEIVQTASVPEEQLPAPVQVPEASVDNQQKLLERLLLVMDAACQSIIYTREKVDAMEQKIDFLWRSLK